MQWWQGIRSTAGATVQIKEKAGRHRNRNIGCGGISPFAIERRAQRFLSHLEHDAAILSDNQAAAFDICAIALHQMLSSRTPQRHRTTRHLGCCIAHSVIAPMHSIGMDWRASVAMRSSWQVVRSARRQMVRMRWVNESRDLAQDGR